MISLVDKLKELVRHIKKAGKASDKERRQYKKLRSRIRLQQKRALAQMTIDLHVVRRSDRDKIPCNSCGVRI